MEIFPDGQLPVKGALLKKENKIFLLYKEIQMGSGCKVIYEEGLPNM
jgi:hypothetical protein